MNLRTIGRGLVALALLLLPSLAHAQGIPAFQSGTLTPGHLLKGAGNGLHMDVGGLTGDANGRGAGPFSITDAAGLGLCSNTVPTSGLYYAFCLGHDITGNALLSVTANGGAIEKSLYLSKNGTLYEIPFVGAGSGNVVGPASSTVDTCATWNNVSGTLLKVNPCVLSPGTTAVGNLPTWNSAVGTAMADSGVPLSSLRLSALRNPTPNSVFVRAGGDDANDCLAASASGGHGPCATVQAALTVGLALDAKSAVLKVDVGPGTFSAPVALNGPNVGGVSSTNFISAASMPLVLISGASSASTTIFGPATYLGQNYCYAILANGGATLALQNLSVQADGGGGSCLVSDLFVQAAQLYIISDVVLKAASGNLISEEENALVYVTPGSLTPGLTLAGNAYNGINVDGNSMFVSDSTVQISGALTFAGACMVNLDYKSVFKITIPNPAFTSGANVTARRFCLAGLSTMAIGNPPTVWPGNSLGIVSNGSRYEAPDAVPCIGGAAGCVSASAPTGLGAGGSGSFSSGSGAYGGAVQLTTGTGASASGGVTIGFPYEMSRGACATFFTQGTGTWNPRAATVLSGFTTNEGLGISWDNNSVALTDAKTYFIGWSCNTTQ